MSIKGIENLWLSYTYLHSTYRTAFKHMEFLYIIFLCNAVKI